MTTFLKKAPVPLATLLLLALMTTLEAFGQNYDANIIALAEFSVQDGAQTIEVEGSFEIAYLDSVTTAGSKHAGEIHIMSFSWDATSEAGRRNLEAGNAISRCASGTFKEASTETEGGRITVQRCSQSEDPLTVSPVRFDLSDGTPETASVTLEYLVLMTFRELDGQCFVDGAASLSLCLYASR